MKWVDADGLVAGIKSFTVGSSSLSKTCSVDVCTLSMAGCSSIQPVLHRGEWC